MSNYSLSDAAIQDLDEICEYIVRSKPKAAVSFLMTFARSVN
ncbi:MAG: hypothetical protein RMY28_021315 [Nostoc sp. ChiSLP01]|nr:type II toxin-antitoxin system RelE/ParE family toxin [Nostoc sp. CmiSLP01]MDZ8288083.1 type II toxin-antitoxin system RelE/ParE family toxin [Nostoc sp. ChiSLP01]